MARAWWQGPGGRLRSGHFLAVVRHLGGVRETARRFGITRTRLWYWRKGTRTIPTAALDQMEMILRQVEAEVTEARLFIREMRPRSERAEALWRARLYRRNHRRGDGEEVEAGLPGDPGRGE